jgi:hypothetical protein
VLLMVSAGATSLWWMTSYSQPRPTHDPAYNGFASPIPYSELVQDTVTIDEALFTLSLSDRRVISNIDGLGFSEYSNIFATDIAEGQHAFAYIWNDNLYILPRNRGAVDNSTHIDNTYIDSTPIETPGRAMMPAWNADGTLLTYVVRGYAGDSVYSVRFYKERANPIGSPLYMLTVPALSAPPISSLGVDRILIAEQVGTTATSLYTVDAYCTGETCTASRYDITTIDQSIDDLDYHPNGAYIAFSTRTDRQVYLLTVRDDTVKPLLPSTLYAYGDPTFSPDGKQIAFIGPNRTVHTLSLQDSRLSVLPNYNVVDVEWIEPEWFE